MKMNFYFSIILIMLTSLPQLLAAQTTMNITEGNNLVIPCTTMCFTIHTTHTEPARSDIYTVDPIPFAPTVLANPMVITLPDDTFSNAIPIPICM
jgi:hypothetical protein